METNRREIEAKDLAAARRLVRVWKLCQTAARSSGALQSEAIRVIAEEIGKDTAANVAGCCSAVADLRDVGGAR